MDVRVGISGCGFCIGFSCGALSGMDAHGTSMRKSASQRKNEEGNLSL